MQKKFALILTLMLTGRAMTLAFLHRVGGNSPGDPPIGWLMPLLRRTGLFVWTAIVVWNVVAIWDALSAYIIHLTVPWPAFFMVQLFGASMFFAATAMHAIILILVCREPLRAELLPERTALTVQPDANDG